MRLIFLSEIKIVTPGSRAGERRQLSLGLISIINFPNSECTDAEGVQGECYTATECAARGGTSSSTCGNGIGVCCYVIMVRV